MVLLGAATSWPAAAAQAPPPRPNVVLLMAEELGYGDLGCQGHPDLQTPHLDALAADGARFTNLHAAAPVCSPTRASCLTGRHPYRCDVRTANAGHLAAAETTLQRMLHRAGDRTGPIEHIELFDLVADPGETREPGGRPRGARCRDAGGARRVAPRHPRAAVTVSRRPAARSRRGTRAERSCPSPRRDS